MFSPGRMKTNTPRSHTIICSLTSTATCAPTIRRAATRCNSPTIISDPRGRLISGLVFNMGVCAGARFFSRDEDRCSQEYFVYFKKIWRDHTEKAPLSACAAIFKTSLSMTHSASRTPVRFSSTLCINPADKRAASFQRRLKQYGRIRIAPARISAQPCGAGARRRRRRRRCRP